MEPLSLIIAFFVAIVSNVYGASAGGAALILIPALIFLGVPAKTATATSIVGFLGMSLMGTLTYKRVDSVDLRLALPAALIAGAGASVGAWLLVTLPNETIRLLLGALILLVLPCLLAKRELGIEAQQTSKLRKVIGYSLFFPLGIHGIVAPGGSTILVTYVFLFCFGQTFLQSAGARMVVFLVMNTIAVSLMASQNIIDWQLGAILFVGMMIGTYLGVKIAIHMGNRWIRWLFMLVVLISAVKLLL